MDTHTHMHMQTALVVSTLDKRKQALVFRAMIYELRSDLLLVEFRRSKVRHDKRLEFA